MAANGFQVLSVAGYFKVRLGQEPGQQGTEKSLPAAHQLTDEVGGTLLILQVNRIVSIQADSGGGGIYRVPE
jgi:hypothetical protein